MSRDTPGGEQQSEPPSARTTAHLDPVETGADLRASGVEADVKAAIEALPPGSALLVVQYGPSAGARFLLEVGRVTAGRDTKADIFLDDITVSRRHCEFLNESGVVTVRDVGSLNGTYVNRSRTEESTLRAGDEVQIGKFRFTFHPSPHQANANPAANI